MKPVFGQAALAAAPEVAPVEVRAVAPAAPDALPITRIAEKYGVTPRALRFYESKGLLAPRRERGVRVYDDKDQRHLTLILKGRKLGFTLRELTQMIEVEEGRASASDLKLTQEKCREQIEIMEKQARDLHEALAELRRMHMALANS
jgi:DNA-binding transcriptional MerR regulator